jgi:hypothetical protein
MECDCGVLENTARADGNGGDVQLATILAPLVVQVGRAADALEQLVKLQAAGGGSEARVGGGPQHEAMDASATRSQSSAVAKPDWIISLEAQVTEVLSLAKKQAKLTQSASKNFYTVAEVEGLTVYKEWTIRDACNKGRIKAKKGDDGRWRVPHDELVRLQEEGLTADETRPQTRAGTRHHDDGALAE